MLALRFLFSLPVSASECHAACGLSNLLQSIREVLAGLSEGSPIDTVLASLEQLNELLLRSGGGGQSSLRVSSIVPLVTKLLLNDMHEASSAEVSDNGNRGCDRRAAAPRRSQPSALGV